jgi:hypothetical protein
MTKLVNPAATAHARARTALCQRYPAEWKLIYAASVDIAHTTGRRQWLSFLDLRDRHPIVWRRLLAAERKRAAQEVSA